MTGHCLKTHRQVGLPPLQRRPTPRMPVASWPAWRACGAGTIFEAPSGAVPERDRRGELAFRAVSYTPWPVEEGTEGERVRIDVGPVSLRKPRTFLFSKTLPQPSQLVVTTLERPLGIVFEEDARRKRVVVAGFTPGARLCSARGPGAACRACQCVDCGCVAAAPPWLSVQAVLSSIIQRAMSCRWTRGAGGQEGAAEHRACSFHSAGGRRPAGLHLHQYSLPVSGARIWRTTAHPLHRDVRGRRAGLAAGETPWLASAESLGRGLVMCADDLQRVWSAGCCRLEEGTRVRWASHAGARAASGRRRARVGAVS